MDMLFFEDEIQKMSKKVGQAEWSKMQLQDPRINGQLQKDQNAQDTEVYEVED